MELIDRFLSMVPPVYSGNVKVYRTVWLFLSLLIGTTSFVSAQRLIQIRTFDLNLQPMKNVEVSINNKGYVSTGEKGETFVEFAESELPIKTIKIKNDQLEPESWSHSKGVLEIVVRKKNYQVVAIFIKDASRKSMANLPVTFTGSKTIKSTTNAEGKLEMLLPLDEKINASQFAISGYEISGLQQLSGENVLIIDPVKKETPPEVITSSSPQQKRAIPEEEYFNNFDLSKLDSIQSLTVFYAVFKNYQIQDLNENVRTRVDKKFNELVQQLQDSAAMGNQQAPIGRISDSSFVRDDVQNLLNQASRENRTLQTQRSEFDEKIRIINQKLERGITTLDPESREGVLSDLLALEKLLTENEGRFYKNLNDYREIINSLKQRYFDFQSLETRLSESEAKRLEEQRVFRQRLIGISLLVVTFAILIILLISFSSRLRKQKQDLMLANGEVQRINENLEGIVTERTKLLADANRELDTFLYRASHDLRSPLSSIIGLCNLALYLSDGEAKELVKKVASTTEGMDKLLKKLSIVSEINLPTNYSKINLLEIVEDVQFKFAGKIEGAGIKFYSDCPGELTFYSYPNLVDVVITNLIENALFYSVMRDPQNARVELKAAIVNDHIEFSVYDNGIGIDRSVQDRVFDMFFKGHVDAKGNGLGLYIVQKSVQALKGNLSLESQPGEYTLLTVKLPVSIIPVTEKLEEAMA